MQVLLNGLVLQLVPENVRQHATVLRAVQQNGLALQPLPRPITRACLTGWRLHGRVASTTGADSGM